MTSRILRSFAFLFFFILGMILLFEFFSFDNWKSAGAIIGDLSRYPHSKTFLGLAAVFFLIIPLVAFYLWNRRRLRLSEYRIPATPEPVSIRLEAISGFVSELAAEFPAVAQSRSTVRKQGPGINIRIVISVFAGQNLLSLAEEIRNTVRTAVQEQLGIPQVGKITIVTGTITDTKLL